MTQWLSFPDHDDKRKQAMLDFVPLASFERKIIDRFGNPDLVGQFLSFHFPESYARSFAPSAVL